MQNVEIFYPESVSAWRNWLKENHLLKQSVWVVFYNKKSSKKSISWSEAVEVALCFGWIDSKKIKIDEETSHQFFSKRRAKSTWSKINKDKIARLTQEGLMAPAGLESVEIAKQNGSWTFLDEVEALIIPKDLEKAFKTQKGSKDNFLSLSKSAKKMMLYRLLSARTTATREKRIAKILEDLK